MVKFRTTLILLLLTAVTAYSQTYITGGEVTGSWTPEGSPYIVEGDMIVAPQERLEIEAGVEVLFSGPFVLEVHGRLEAIGTATDSIYFKSADTTGFASGNYNGWYGIGFVGYNSITSENSRFEYCNIEFSAGSGITCVQYPNFQLKHSRLANNKEYGLLLADFSDITLNDVIIGHNAQGGISANFSAPTINGFEIKGNSGSGISTFGNSNSAVFQLSNGSIHHNQTIENGGGIAISGETMMNISDVEISNNIALNGAGLFATTGYISMNNAIVSFNHAQNGGGVLLENNAILNADFAVISHNLADVTGGGVYNENSHINISQSTIADNNAGSAGGFYFELYEEGGNLINSCIVWNNGNESIQVALIAPTVEYSDIEGGFEGVGNIDEDPLFAQSDNNDYHLVWENFPVADEYTSPCIDSGDELLTPDPDGTTADMGAYYYHQQMFVTKVNQTSLNDVIKIYPNPVASTLFVQGNDEIQSVEIANLNGQMVRQIEQVSKISKVQVDDLPAGIYLVIVKDTKGNAATKKLIKQ